MTVQTIRPHEEIAILKELDVLSNTTDNFGFSIYDSAITPTIFKRLRNVVWYLLMLDAGLRVSECCRLPLESCYFHTEPVKTLFLDSAVSKMSHPREIPVTDRLFRALKRFKIHGLRNGDRSSWFYLISGHHDFQRLTSRTIEYKLREASMAALGRPVNPHMLRHTFATKLLKITNIRTVQELLGHKHLSSTQIYTHVTFDDKKDAILSLDSNDKAALRIPTP